MDSAYINDVHITYKWASPISNYNHYKTLFESLADSASELITREKAIDPLFMGLGDYDVKSDGSGEIHSYDVKSDGSNELHFDYVKRVYVKSDGSEAPHVYKLYYLYYLYNKREEIFSTNPYFSMPDFQKLYGLSYSPIADLVIKNGSKLVIVEAKRKGQDLNASEYKGEDAIELLNKWEKDEVDQLSKFCDKHGNPHDPSKEDENNKPYLIDNMPEVNMPDVSTIRVRWYNSEKYPKTDPTYNAGTEFTLTFKNKDRAEVKFYQSDWYLSDLLHAKADVGSVVLTNGKLARRFYKEDGQIKSEDYDLTNKSQFDAFRDDVKSDLA